MKSINELMNEVCIKDPAQQVIKTGKPEDMLALLAQIKLRIEEDGTTPAPLMDIVRVIWTLDPDAEADELFEQDNESPKKYCYIKDDKGEKWLPLYTELDEIKDLDYENGIEDRPILDTVVEALVSDDFAGVVINPVNEGLALRKEALYTILEMCMDGNEDTQGGDSDE